MALFIGLKVGIVVPSLSFGEYHIEKLYIKLNKKLTLKVQKVVIPKTKASPSSTNIDKVFHQVKSLLTLFDEITLEEIDFENNTFKIFFIDNIFYVVSDDYEVAGNIEHIGKKLVADISLLYIKKERVRVTGKVIYYLKEDKLESVGKFEAYEIRGSFAAKKEKRDVDFSIQSETFTNLRTLIQRIGLKPAVERWIIDEIHAKKYKLYSLAGKGTITPKGFVLNQDALRGEVLFDDVTIRYHHDLPPIVANSFLLRYAKGTLYFDLKHPTYEGRDLEGSSVRITHLVGKEPTMLLLDLKIHSQIDSVVQKILKAYKLNIPVKEKGEKALLNIAIALPLVASKEKIEVKVDVTLKEGDVWIDGVKLPVKEGRVSYRDGEILLRDIVLEGGWYKGVVNGNVNLLSKKANLTLANPTVALGAKEKFFLLKKRKLLLTLEYTKGVKLLLPLLKTTIQSQKKGLKISLEDLRSIAPYLRNVGFKVEGGHLDISTKDFQTYRFQGVLKRNGCFFYNKHNLCYTQVPISGEVTPKNFLLYAFDKRFAYNKQKNLLTLNGLNLDLKKFLASDEKGSKKSKKKMQIVGKKSTIRYGEYQLVTDRYRVNVSPKGTIRAEGFKDGDRVSFYKKGKQIEIRASRVKDALLHPLIHFKGLKGGRYSLKKWGNIDKVMHGEILIEGGVVKGFKAYNNTLAFINTLPALVTLHAPGFSKKGFKIKKGEVKYRMEGKKIFFEHIYIKGASSTIVGTGNIDLKKRTIEMKLAIQTARELGSVVGNIPLVGYILMGEDKSMSIGLHVSGTLDNPKVETSASKEILTLPFEFIKRVVESPIKLLKGE